MDTLKPLVFSWRARQTWRRGACNAAARRQRAPPPSQNPLAALQGWRNCPQTRHLLGQERRCSVSSQRWSAGVTPPPLIARPNRQRLLLPPGKRSRIVSLFCMLHVISAHAVIKIARIVLFAHQNSLSQLLSQLLFFSCFHAIHYTYLQPTPHAAHKQSIRQPSMWHLRQVAIIDETQSFCLHEMTREGTLGTGLLLHDNQTHRRMPPLSARRQEGNV
jgi:hypothetical protein